MKSPLLIWFVVGLLALVLNLLFETGLGLVLKTPVITDFCKEEQVQVIPKEKNECVAIGGEWVPDVFVQTGLPKPDTLEPAPIEIVREGYCDASSTCLGAFKRATEDRETTFFLSFIGFGLFSLAAYRIFRRYLPLAFGFFFGGVLALVVAAARYWPLMSEWTRIGVLALALAALIWIAVKREDNSHVHEEIRP